jgi:hypothetical protein
MIAQIVAIDPRYRDLEVLKMHINLPLREYDALWANYEAHKKAKPQPNFLRDHMALWAAYAEGKTDRVRELLVTLGKNSPFYSGMALVVDKPDKLLAQLRSLADGPEAGRGAFSNAALFAGQYGDPELAVKLLRRAYLGPGWAGNFPVWFPPLSEARKTESFKQFVRDIGWAEMYRDSGDWGDFCKPNSPEDFECF